MKIKISFLTEWHCGNGTTGGADLDLTLIRDEDGLPYVPGRTLRGLLKEQMEYIDAEALGELFGHEGDQRGSLIVQDTLISEPDAANISEELKPMLFRRIVSTKIENGIAVDRNLRAIEYAVPLTLYGVISFPEKFASQMSEAAGMIKAIGLGKNKGFGSCHVTIEENE